MHRQKAESSQALGVMASTAAALGWAGLVQAGIVLFPLRIGEVVWEITSFGELAISLLPLGAGLAGLGAVGIAMGRRGITAGVAIVTVFVALLVAVGLLLIAADLPLVWQSVRAGNPAQLKTAVVKAGVLLAVYTFGFVWLAVILFRSVSRLGGVSR